MKILYAAGNRIGSYFILRRFINSISHKNYNLKVAAYKKSSNNFDVDYTLDCLLNFTDPTAFSFNKNYTYYKNEIRRFAPDLIISDFEVYSSTIAMELNINLIQYSPIVLYYALDKDIMQSLGFHKHYSYLLEENHKKSEYINNIMDYSKKKFILSHLCDCKNRPKLLYGFEWCRPSFILGEGSKRLDYILALAKPNTKVINEFKNKNIAIYQEDDYIESIENCSVVISDGTEMFLTDAFYNQKSCISYPRYDDIESIICSYVNSYCNLDKNNLIEIDIDDETKFISEYLGKL